MYNSKCIISGIIPGKIGKKLNINIKSLCPYTFTCMHVLYVCPVNKDKHFHHKRNPIVYPIVYK